VGISPLSGIRVVEFTARPPAISDRPCRRRSTTLPFLKLIYRPADESKNTFKDIPDFARKCLRGSYECHKIVKLVVRHSGQLIAEHFWIRSVPIYIDSDLPKQSYFFVEI
jgi:hypothetical protein